MERKLLLPVNHLTPYPVQQLQRHRSKWQQDGYSGDVYIPVLHQERRIGWFWCFRGRDEV
ncbi:exonuclease RdgC [Anopheles sinensis]|uniref:Exonuclease RdgC n=1 Tax=Anopheles sinensis TaxID=74873 RepID=A0A084WCF2_ANOSI|nr:exonuclease RdgC [Anopheles sinensis]